MSSQQLTQTVQPIWRSKSNVEKLMTKVLIGLAIVAAGNSGYQIVTQLVDNAGLWLVSL